MILTIASESKIETAIGHTVACPEISGGMDLWSQNPCSKAGISASSTGP
jgi:hypothetical protein